jgi:thiamine-phosphate pyrophosphorylase
LQFLPKTTPDPEPVESEVCPLTSEISKLNAIVDADAAARAGWRPLDLARAFLDGGARFLQFRAKAMPGDEMLATASAIVQLAHRHGAIVIVNDRADVARLAGADGVHVGQDDLTPAAVRTIVGTDAIVGVSTHTPAQLADAVREPVDYVAIGPVFGTTTKATGYDAVGLDAVREAARLAGERALPVVAIGGITIDTARSVLDAGAASVAVIGDLVAHGDPAQQVRAFLTRMEH